MKSSDETLSLTYFLDIAFVREISPKLSGGFGCYRNERVKTSVKFQNHGPYPYHSYHVGLAFVYTLSILVAKGYCPKPSQPEGRLGDFLKPFTFRVAKIGI